MTRRSTNVIVPSLRGSVAHQELTVHAGELDRLRHRWHAAKIHLTQELSEIEASANRTLPPLISSRLIASLAALVRTELAEHDAALKITPRSLGGLMSSNAQLAPITDLVAAEFAQLRALLRAIAAVVTGLSLPRQQAGGAGVQVPLVAFMGRGKEFVTHFTRTIFAHQPAAPALTEMIAGNLARAFGESPSDDRAIPSPSRLDGSARDAAVITFADTPLLPLLLTPVTIVLSDEIRHKHTHIVASPGWGKSQHLQEIIVGFLERPDPPSLVVIDSQGDMLDKIARLQLFAPGKGRLAERLIVVDPRDVAHPPALNLFARDQRRLAGYDAATREMISNGVIELYETIYGAILGAEPTQMQQLLSRMLTRLVLTIPGATIRTLRDVLEDPSQYQFAIDRLDGDAGHFLRRHLASEQYRETRQQILRRLWGILEQPTFSRMLSTPALKLDLFDCLQTGKIVLVNTAIDFLKSERSAVMGRIFLAMTLQATLERAGIPKQRRRSAFVIVDEAHQYLDRSCEQMLAMARKYRVGLILAHQNLGQLSPGLAAALASNTAIKLAGGVSDRDAHVLARDMRSTPDELLSLGRSERSADFALSVAGLTPSAVPVSVSYGILEARPRMSTDDFHRLIAANRRRIAAAPALPQPTPPRSSSPSPQPQRPKPARPPRIVPTDPDDWHS